MKKIIAAAVATAFVGPAFAADITISGEVQTQFTNGDSSNVVSNSAEFFVKAAEEFDNGISVSAYIEQQATSNFNYIAISGPFGTLSTGSDGDSALTAYEDKADKAMIGGGQGGASTGSSGVPVLFEPNLGIDGLTVGIGYAAGSAETDEVTDFAIAYSAMGLSLTYGQADSDASDETTTVTSVSYSMGPFYVAMDSVENKGGTANNDAEAVAVTYDYGSGSVYFEQTEYGVSDDQETAYGVTYTVGGGLKLFAENEDAEADADDATHIGVEYKF